MSARCLTSSATDWLVDAGQHVDHHVAGQHVELFKHRPRGGRQEQPLGAPVVRVAAPLDQAVVAEPVDQPGQRDRLDVEHFCEFRLLEALIALEPEQHGPLRAGHAELTRLLVGIGAQQPGYVIEEKREIAFQGKIRHTASLYDVYYKQPY